MVLIKVRKRDRPKAFKILLNNGKFSRIDGLFRIDEHEDRGLKQLKNENIEFEKIN